MEMGGADLRSKVRGAIIGIAYGDAFGMATEMWTPEQILDRVGRVDAFRKGHPSNPISAKLVKGEVTDDTVNSVLVIQMLAENQGVVDAGLFIKKLKNWIQSAGKSSTVVGPSTRRAIDLLEQGVPMQETGKTGITNGGAMKILPVGLVAGIRAWKSVSDGILHSEGTDKCITVAKCTERLDSELLLSEVANLCMPTHYTSCAIGAAAAIAAGGAMAVCGERDPGKIFDYMVQTAKQGEKFGNPVCGPSVAARMEMNRYFADHNTEEKALDFIYRYAGTGLPAAESIPAAAALFYLSGGNAQKCARYAANIGGDTDTMGAMACGICGAFQGDTSFAGEEIEMLEQVNGILFDELTDQLISCIV